MFGRRQEEETFKFLPKKEDSTSIKTLPEPNIKEVMEKMNTITEQINIISRYLSYLSQKFDKTIDNAMTYDKTLDTIEARINSLKKRIEQIEIVSPDVDLSEDRERAI